MGLNPRRSSGCLAEHSRRRRLGAFTANQTALAGPVTVVAKVMLPVRGQGNFYVDLAFAAAVCGSVLWTTGELKDDATVLAPGYVLQPIAIYKERPRPGGRCVLSPFCCSRVSKRPGGARVTQFPVPALPPPLLARACAL